MFGHSIAPQSGRGPAIGFVPLAAGLPPSQPQMSEVYVPAKQTARDYGADVRIPQADRVTRALLDAIF
jgi:hypothetical protein